MAALNRHDVTLSERPPMRKGRRSKSAVHATVAEKQYIKFRIALRPSVSSQWQEHKAPPPRGAHNDRPGCEDETVVIVSTACTSFLCVTFRPRKPTAIIWSYKTFHSVEQFLVPNFISCWNISARWQSSSFIITLEMSFSCV